MRHVKISTKVERRIKGLKQAGKAGKLIARKAEAIIEGLKSGAFLDQNEFMGPVTKYGEKRLKGCRKYDFGSGYRLITLQKHMMILVPFIGTHDECDKWLETNNKSKHIAKGRGTTVSLKDRPKQNIDGSETPPRCENDELNMDDTLHDLDDETLRTIFCGIISSSQKKNNARHSDYGQ